MKFIKHMRKGTRLFALYKVSTNLFKLCDLTYDKSTTNGIMHTQESLDNFFNFTTNKPK